MRTKGFTLIEVLVVISILAILAMTLIFTITHQRDKAENARIKSDLSRLKIAFEDYYNDQNCYPPVEWFDDADDCGSELLRPYLSSIPCDPHTGLPYVLETNTNSPAGCIWFKLYGSLKDPSNDPQALAIYDPSGSSLGNFGVSSSNTNVTVSFIAPSPTPTPSSIPNSAWCSAINNCSSFDPNLWSCTPSYPANTNCGNSGCPTVSTCSPL